MRLLIRILLIPVIAGVSYEFIQWAGNSDSKIAYYLSKPGLWMQGLTTKEPQRDMVEVAIQSVEHVFDWRKYLDDMKNDPDFYREDKKKKTGKCAGVCAADPYELKAE